MLESFNGRKRAKDLPKHSKHAVEIAIEQDEQAAIDWLESVSHGVFKNYDTIAIFVLL